MKKYTVLRIFLLFAVLLPVMSILLSGCSAALIQSIDLSANIPDNWPIDMPDDVLPLPGKIDEIWTGDRYIRMWYSDVPREVVIAYARAMEKNGFTCEFIQYTTNDSDHGKIVFGTNFHAVTLKKGEYDFNLEISGDGGALYSLSGLPEGTGINSIKWPEEWADLVPRPRGVNFSDSFDVRYNDKNLFVSGVFEFFEFTDEQFTEKHLKINKAVVREYIELLISMGYREPTDWEKQVEGFISAGTDFYLINDTVIIGISSEDNVQWSNVFHLAAQIRRERPPAQNSSPYSHSQIALLLTQADSEDYITYDEYRELYQLWLDENVDEILKHKGIQKALTDERILLILEVYK